MSEHPTVLLAIQDSAVCQQLIDHLQDQNIHIVAVSDSDTALAMCLEWDFSLLIVGTDLEPMGGFPASKVIRLNERNAHSPMIILSNDAFIDAAIIHDKTEFLMSRHSLLQPMKQLFFNIKHTLYPG
ncbi:MAG: hypothetical protein O3A01_08785 [bacterium]|nr:hypothetical protein [bacterium]